LFPSPREPLCPLCLANQEEAYRNHWLEYAWRWVRQHDPNGFVQMPASRCLAAPPGEFAWYYAHTASPATPQGFDQEETIKSIWLSDKASDGITPVLNLLLGDQQEASCQMPVISNQ
jgi:hypothetical protein